MDKDGQLIDQIYDCAANPELWPSALIAIRDSFNAAYVLTKVANHAPPRDVVSPIDLVYFTPWDESWFQKLGPIMNKMIGQDEFTKIDIDEAWIYSQQAPIDAIQNSEFENLWVKPQGLADCIKFNYLKRNNMYGVVSVTTHRERGFFSADEGARVAQLAPHIRRAMMINELVDRGRLALALYRKVLDQLSAPVFILGTGRRIAYCNAAAENMLEEGNFLIAQNGTLSTKRSNGAAQAFIESTDRAIKGSEAIGIHGIGIPLLGQNGDRVAAYVLPIGGNDLRGDLGDGHAAMFVARRGEQQPMIIEILRTVFDLTPAEARIASLVSKGDGPQVIAKSLGLSVNTVRSHLARCYSKTNSSDQTALAATVNALTPAVL